MRHPFRYLSLSKPKTVLTAPREAPQLGSKGFSIRQRSQWTTDMGDSGAPPPPQGKGGGQTGGARDAANSLLQFLRPRTEITPPSPVAPPNATETTTEGWVLAQQQQYINMERPGYDGVTPIIEQMLPEISQADKNTKNTSMRGALAVARPKGIRHRSASKRQHYPTSTSPEPVSSLSASKDGSPASDQPATGRISAGSANQAKQHYKRRQEK